MEKDKNYKIDEAAWDFEEGIAGLVDALEDNEDRISAKSYAILAADDYEEYGDDPSE